MTRGLSVFVDACFPFSERDEQARGTSAHIVGTPSQALFLAVSIDLHKFAHMCGMWFGMFIYVWNVHIYYVYVCVCVCVCV